MENDNIVVMKGITKQFGSVQALNNVNLELRRGELLGLVGDNAAGKSTLMKVLFGAVIPDEGEIWVEGKKVSIHTPRDAQAVGISMIFQDLALFNNLDVSLNVCAGREYTKRILGIPLLDKKRMHEEAAELLAQTKININSTRLPVEKMSGGQRQMIACARAIGFKSRILLMDEPTAALGVREANRLLQLIAGLRDQGLSIIMITQRIPDLMAIANRVMILKGGIGQGDLNIKDCTIDNILELIIKGRGNYEDILSPAEELEHKSFG